MTAKMFRRLTAAVSLVLTAACIDTVNAQIDPGTPNRGMLVTILPTSTAKRVVRYEYNGSVAYVRIETSEPGARRNEQPYSVAGGQIRAALQAVRLPSEKNEPLFNDKELDEISAPLSRALAQATDTQDVCFAVSGRHGTFAVIAPRRVTTARVFRTDGHLNMVFGMVRHDWDSEFKGTGTVIPFEPGRRAEPLRDEPPVSIDPAYGESRRGDWIVLRDLDSVAAPTPAAAPATAAPAPATAAPAPATAAPAPATAAPAPATAAPAPATAAPAPATAAPAPATAAPAPATAAPAPATAAPAPAAVAPAAAAATPAPAPAAPAPARAATAPPPSPTPSATPGAKPSYDAIAQRLRTLQKLRDDGLITPQEYEQKRQEILRDL